MHQCLCSIMHLVKRSVPVMKTLHLGHCSYLSNLGRKRFEDNFHFVGLLAEAAPRGPIWGQNVACTLERQVTLST